MNWSESEWVFKGTGETVNRSEGEWFEREQVRQ